MSAARLEPAEFEALYRAREDPWDFATSTYEARKYDRTLAALGERRFARVLEAGCSIGVFTALLASRCERLLAVDAAPTAVARARERCDGVPGVSVMCRTLPDELPAGPFDLLVTAELLYYWSAELLLGALPALEATIAPGGAWLLVHWRPPTRTYPLRGDEVHELVLEHTTLRPTDSHVERRFRLDLLERPR